MLVKPEPGDAKNPYVAAGAVAGVYAIVNPCFVAAVQVVSKYGGDAPVRVAIASAYAGVDCAAR